MSTSLANDNDFLRSLAPHQRKYFLQRESALHIRLQEVLRDLSRGFGAISQINGETQAVALSRAH